LHAHKQEHLGMHQCTHALAQVSETHVQRSIKSAANLSVTNQVAWQRLAAQSLFKSIASSIGSKVNDGCCKQLCVVPAQCQGKVKVHTTNKGRRLTHHPCHRWLDQGLSCHLCQSVSQCAMLGLSQPLKERQSCQEVKVTCHSSSIGQVSQSCHVIVFMSQIRSQLVCRGSVG
jgi:hypothetical protein